MQKTNMTFNDFCVDILDGMYTPELDYDSQSTGYKQLRKMVVENITPASKDEVKRWETSPTAEELFGTPNIKYLRFLHPLVRPLVIEHWEVIKNLKVD